MQLLNISILPEGVLGWSMLIIIFILLVLFVTILNPRAKYKYRSHEDVLDISKPDTFHIVQDKITDQAKIWKSKKFNASKENSIYTSFNRETNEAVVVRLEHNGERVFEIERITYFIHNIDIKNEDIEAKEKLNEAVSRGIQAFNDIQFVDSDTFMESGELIGMMHVLQSTNENTGETVLFTDSNLSFRAIEEKLFHEGYEKI